VPLRDKNNRPGKGVTLTDMGAKTTGNDLDNASIEFNSVRMDRTALLDKHCDVFTVREGKQGKGVYVERGGDASEGATSGTKKHRLTNMDRIGQRLFTGRIAVAQGAHEFRSLLFQRTKEATDNKPCWVPSAGKSDSTATPATRALSDVPQLKSLYLEETRRHERTGRFLRVVESALCASLLSKTRPDSVLVEAVAAAKGTYCVSQISTLLPIQD
jgi:acyl-CoA oxidase